MISVSPKRAPTGDITSSLPPVRQQHVAGLGRDGLPVHGVHVAGHRPAAHDHAAAVDLDQAVETDLGKNKLIVSLTKTRGGLWLVTVVKS